LNNRALRRVMAPYSKQLSLNKHNQQQNKQCMHQGKLNNRALRRVMAPYSNQLSLSKQLGSKIGVTNGSRSWKPGGGNG
jgi:hypothetical protein